MTVGVIGSRRVPGAVQTALDDGPTLPLVTLSLYALLKVMAFRDQDDERCYGTEHEGAGVPFEYSRRSAPTDARKSSSRAV